MISGTKFYTSTTVKTDSGGYAYIGEYTATGTAPGVVAYIRIDGKPAAVPESDVFLSREEAAAECARRLRAYRDEIVKAYNARIEELEATL